MTACGGYERACQSESTYAQLVNMISRIVGDNRFRDGSLENRPARAKPQRVEGEISIVQ